MTTNNETGGQELLSIKTEKVYDWVVNEATFDLTLEGLLPIGQGDEGLSCDDIVLDTISCEVFLAPTPIEMNKVNQKFIIDGKEVTLQIVTIQKAFVVDVFVDLVESLGGGRIRLIGDNFFRRCEQVILCAPDDTDIEVMVIDRDCFVCQADCRNVFDPVVGREFGEVDVTVSVRLCQSIQSIYDVTLEIEADFCEPRDVFSFSPCPAPLHPPQCPVLFPNNLTDTSID